MRSSLARRVQQSAARRAEETPTPLQVNQQPLHRAGVSHLRFKLARNLAFLRDLLAWLATLGRLMGRRPTGRQSFLTVLIIYLPIESRRTTIIPDVRNQVA